MNPNEQRLDRRHRARSRARAWALQVHYRWESQSGEQSLTESLEDTLRNRYVAEPRRGHLRRLVETLDENLTTIDRALEGALDNWRLGRLGGIDRGVLRIGAVEMMHLDDVPPKVALKEAIRLAERYGSEESAGFVNGVLDSLLPDGPDGG